MALAFELKKLFNISDDTIFVQEGFYDFTLRCDLLSLMRPTEGQLVEFINRFEKRDRVELIVMIGDNAPLVITRSSQAFEFIKSVEKEDTYLEDEHLTLELKIAKTIENNILSVYSLENFAINLTQLPPRDLLQVFAKELTGIPGIHFQLYEDYVPFRAGNIVFSKEYFDFGKLEQRELTKKIRDTSGKIKENCHFSNYEEIKVTPYSFYIQDKSNEFPLLNQLFDKLALILSVIAIFNVTTVNDEGLAYKLTGYRTFEGFVKYDELPDKSVGRYYEIFEWIYSDKSRVSDKLGLARNILSISLKEGSLKIDQHAFNSIQSGYQIYLKENINRYIELRGKMTDQLLALTGSASQVINNYVDSFKKSLLAYLSFFLSVLIVRILSNGSYVDVFTKDATILSLVFLVICVVYLVFSEWEYSKECKRLNDSYENLKERYTDLLNIDDINRILNHDKDYSTQLKFIEIKRRAYLVLWAISLVIILIAMLSMSTFLNWEVISKFIQGL
jgi:hypothetical protein